MINSKILISVIIVLLIGVAAAGYQITNPTGISSLFGSQGIGTTDSGQTGTGTSGQDSSGQNQIGTGGNSAGNSGQGNSGQGNSGQGNSGQGNSGQNQSGTGGGVVKIGSTEAQSIAEKYIQQAGTSAGAPKLTTWDNGKKVYVVPVVSTSNRTRVGEIYIDAQTGKNVGGAGGAPNG